MGKLIDLNPGWYTCESCGTKFDPEVEDYGVNEEDNNYFCQKCCEDMPEFNGWGVFQDYPDEWHIRPINEPDHLHDKMCHCKPKVETENGIDIVVHNSFDGRELLEEVLEILKST